jgi:hypothetical protein
MPVSCQQDSALWLYPAYRLTDDPEAAAVQDGHHAVPSTLSSSARPTLFMSAQVASTK